MDLSQCLELRNDLVWTLHQFADGPSYSVFHPGTGQHFQVGMAEYLLVSQWDGKTTVGDSLRIATDTAQQAGHADWVMDAPRAMMTAQWFLRNQLARPKSPHTDRLDAFSSGQGAIANGRSSQTVSVSPLCVKTRIANPDRWIARLSESIRWLPLRGVWVIGWIWIFLSAITVAAHWPAWGHALRPLSDPTRWWVVAAAAILLRIAHELAHGIVAHRKGVRVTEFGILWVLLVPLPYVDVSQSWQCTRRRDRIAIALAGMFVELFIAAIAVSIFACSSDEWLRHVCATVAVTASVVTILFNANVLMRFDGYYILVDLIGYPNLYGDALASWRNRISRWVFGIRESPLPLPVGPLGTLIRFYGFAVALWRALVWVGLVIAAERLLGGIGQIIALVAIVAAVVHGVRRLVHRVRDARPVRACVGMTACVVLAALVWHLPVPGGIHTQGIVQFHDPDRVRTEVTGFVRDVLVTRGQRVHKGDPLVVLENHRLQRDVTVLKVQLAAHRLRFRKSLADGRLASAAAQQVTVEQWENQWRQRCEEQSQLVVRAPSDGVVDAPESLAMWNGRYVDEGTQLMRVVRPGSFQVTAMVSAEDRNEWERFLGKDLVLKHVVDRRVDVAKLVSIDPQATVHLPHPALGAQQGGSLAVRTVATGGSSQLRSDHAPPVRLLEPMFRSRLIMNTPSETDTSEWREGQRVLVTVPANHRTLGQMMWRAGKTWLSRRLSRQSIWRQWTSFSMPAT